MGKKCGNRLRAANKHKISGNPTQASDAVGEAMSLPGRKRLAMMALEPRIMLHAAGFETAEASTPALSGEASNGQTQPDQSHAEREAAPLLSATDKLVEPTESAGSRVVFIDGAIEDSNEIIAQFDSETQVVKISDVAETRLFNELLSEAEGGQVPVLAGPQGQPHLQGTWFRIVLKPDGGAPPPRIDQQVRGLVILRGTPESYARRIARQIMAVLLRESGF